MCILFTLHCVCVCCVQDAFSQNRVDGLEARFAIMEMTSNKLAKQEATRDDS